MFGSDNKDGDRQDTVTPQANDWQHPGTPIDDQPAAVADQSPQDEAPAVTEPTTVQPTSEPVSEGAEPELPQPSLTTPSAETDLHDIKQKALSQLTPLIDQLDQSPEEKFRTLMMTIQAADDQSLVSAAYEAASQITDEKAKAQALLDIVNEINYFAAQQN